MKITSNLLKCAIVVFLVLSVILWACAGCCDAGTASYKYNSVGKPDPFRPFMDLEKKDRKLREAAPKSPLQKISIDQLRLVGIVRSGKKMIAMVEDSKGEHRHYVLHRGTRIGMNEGRVVKILTDRVIIVERIKYPSGKIMEKRVILKLRTEENGGKS